ncbi:MAG: hypothetical protein KAQ83_03450, partial [Nanoarchaeota archaeon]|nr:hypothetical protein [Nanoarchaeota archaeon]
MTIGGETGEKLTWRSTCSDEYYITTIDGTKEELDFNCIQKDMSEITCIFEDAMQVHTCSASIGSCTGLGECNFTAEAASEERIMFTSTCGDYGYLTFGIDNEVSFECGNIRTERNICDFEEDSEKRVCMSNEYGVSCQGVGRCLVSITGQINDRVRWKTDNSKYGYSLLDGTNEYITFSDESVKPISEIITCEFANSNETYTCQSGYDSCSNSGLQGTTTPTSWPNGCSMNINAEKGIQITWSSTFPGSVPKITRQDGKDEIISFSSSENCLNEIDDNGNDLIDCEDNSCFGFIDEENGLECVAGQWLEYDCTDGEDNDLINGADCTDVSRCKHDDKCVYPEFGTIGICSDGFDNDGDGDIDKNDSDCLAPSFILEPTAGIVGSSFTLTGNNLGEAGEEAIVNFAWLALEQHTFILEEQGNFEYNGIIPDVGVGDYAISLVSPRLTRTLTYRVFDEIPSIIQKVTCNFSSDSFSEEYICNYITDDGLSFEFCRASNVHSECSGTLQGFEAGQEFAWYSNGLTTEDSPTYFSENDEEINFIEPPQGGPDKVFKENVTCIFDDGSGDNVISPVYSCSGYPEGQAEEGSMLTCSGRDRCTIEISGDVSINYVWTSTVPDTKEVVNFLNNEDDNLKFISPKYIEANWNCKDGFYIDSATSPIPLTKASWLGDYIKPSCDSHEGISSYNLVEDNTEETFTGKAFASLFGEPEIRETFTCVFDGSINVETCYSGKGRCEGIGKCTFNISAIEGDNVSVRSSIVGAGVYIAIIDGVDEIGIFSVPNKLLVSEEVTCLFTQSHPLEQKCYSPKGECLGIDRCNITIKGELNEPVTWKSTVEGSLPVETIIKGGSKVIEFVENIEEPSISFIV